MVALLPATPMTVRARLAFPRVFPAIRRDPLRDSGRDLHAPGGEARRLRPPATVFAPLDIGATIIERTKHSVVATSLSPALVGMHDVILAFI